MNKRIKNTILLFLLLLGMPAWAQNLTEEQKKAVYSFIQLVENRDWESLSDATKYPLNRFYPILDIENSADFLARKESIFDDSLIALILNSDVDSSWSEVGWRGIMLGRGTVWLDTDGSLIAINYQTETEKLMRNSLIADDRALLHPTLVEFERPILQMDLGKFLIRIDELDPGNYRLAKWSPNSQLMSSQPDAIAENGELEYHGSGGNHSYTFVVEDYLFVFYISVLGKEEDAPAELSIYKDDQLIQNYPAIWLKN